MTRERGDHLLMAIACLALTLLAIVISVVTGLAVFRVGSGWRRLRAVPEL